MSKPRTVETALRTADALLRSAGITDAGRESETILACLLSVDRTAVLAHSERLITPKIMRLFQRLIRKRCAGWPLAYVTGLQPFYGLDWLVERNVLIPRPETEGLVDLALKQIPPNATKWIADIGTGSGCIAITLSRYRPKCNIFAVDRSRSALRIAKMNARRHGVGRQLTFKFGHLLTPLIKQPLDFVVANLPYLTPKEIDKESTIRFEPRLALDAGPTGLRPFIGLFEQLRRRADRPRVLLEVDPRRQKLIGRLIEKTLPNRQTSWRTDSFGRIRYCLIG